MMRRSEFKKKFDPELGKYKKSHIYGEGIIDVFKSFGKAITGETMKKAAKEGIKKGVKTAATKTGEHVGEHLGKKAGDKIVQMLNKDSSKKPNAKKVKFNTSVKSISQKEIDQMMNNVLSGGKVRKK